MSVNLNKPVHLGKTELHQERIRQAQARRKAAARRVTLKKLHRLNAAAAVDNQTGA